MRLFFSQETVKRIKSGAYATQRPGWQKVTPLGQDMVKKLLVLSEERRLRCGEALRHGWVVSAKKLSCPAGQEEPAALAVTVIRLLQQMLKLEMPQRSSKKRVAPVAFSMENVAFREVFRLFLVDFGWV